MTQVRILIATIGLILSTFPLVFGQDDIHPPSRGIINARATSLPKPKYTQELIDLCVYGQVQIEVLLNENGSVLETKPLSGDELMFPIAIEAAKQAMFSTPINQRVRSRGIIVYNFPPKNQCIEAGIVNSKTITQPLPNLQHLNISEEIEIRVRVVIDGGGNIVAAKALSGSPIVQAKLEMAARRTKFSAGPHGGPLRVSGLLVYKIKPAQTVVLVDESENQ